MKPLLWRKVLAGSLAALFLVSLGLVSVRPSRSAQLPNRFPRLGNYFLTDNISSADAERLARWDVVVLGAELQYTHAWLFPALRSRNPNIIILAYIQSQEIPLNHQNITDTRHPHYKQLRGVDSGWWLTSASGSRVAFWPGTNMLNLTNHAPLVNGVRWNTYLAQFMHDEIMSTGLWNGIYYDNVWPDISWMNGGNLDMNRDGRADTFTIDAAWREGMQTLMDRSRALEGPEAIIIGNGGGQYYPAMNGRLIEEYPSAYDGYWPGATSLYFSVMNKGGQPPVVILNAKSKTAQPTDYQTMRYLLASSLLHNGFFSFDKGQYEHAALWTYDEYKAYLGLPVAAARNLLQPASTTVTPGLWRRDFQFGVVLVNSTSITRTVQLGEGYEKLSGNQVPAVNSGQVVTSVTLAPEDGILLLKRQFQIDNGQYANGALTQIMTVTGQNVRQGFFSYSDEYAAGAEVVAIDLDQDSRAERVVAKGNKVTIFDYRGLVKKEFYPYGSDFKHEVQIAVGNVDTDHYPEIVTGVKSGFEPRVKIFALTGAAEHRGWLAYGKKSSGVNVAVADVTGDGRAEIITGPGRGEKPEIRIFNQTGKRLNRFSAYAKNFRGGVRVGAGQLVGGSKAEIVTAPGPGGGPHIRIFYPSGKSAAPGFFAFDQKFRAGLMVSVSDTNHDHRNEIVISVPIVY